MRRKVKGFTLIELVIVIVILGILAAVAIPKFADMQNNARVAQIRATVSAVRSGLGIQRGQYMLGDTTNDGNYWPTLASVQNAVDAANLQNEGCPVDTVLPAIAGTATVVAPASATAAAARTVTAAAGYCYWATSGIFYANTTDQYGGDTAVNTF